MPSLKREVRVFIAGSDDVRAERKAVEGVIWRWNENTRRSDDLNLLLRPISWERAVVSPSPGSSQSPIDEELRLCDFLIVIFRRKLGENTRHEIEIFLDLKRHVLAYRHLKAPKEVAKYANGVTGVAKLYRGITDLERTAEEDLSPGLWRHLQDVKERPIAAYSGREGDAPSRYWPESTLSELEAGDRLVVVGRTCYRWLVTMGQGDLIRVAIEKGATITFVVQDFWSNALAETVVNEMPKIRTHLEEAKGAFERIRASLEPSHLSRLALKYSCRPIRNSRVLFYRATGEGHKLHRVSLDVGMELVPKPYVVVTEGGLAARDIRETEEIVSTALAAEEFEWLSRSPKRELEEQLRWGIVGARSSHSFSSPLRRQAPERLVRQMVRWAIASSPPPPLSVQILLTEKCSTQCCMCGYFGRSKGNVLSLADLELLLEDVRDMGTRSVILSGGEPLVHDHIVEVLAHAKRIGLKTGLLTSGILGHSQSEGEGLAKVCRAIARSCSWVQVSLDSFLPESFEAIRKGGKLVACKNFLKELRERNGFAAIEICCTIQKENFGQLVRDNLGSIIAGAVPRGLPIRFKLAHSAWGDEPVERAQDLHPKDQSFLLTREQLESLLLHWAPGAGFREDHPTNRQYIVELLHQGTADLEVGLPARRRLQTLGGRPCDALKHILFIDCNGDIYPCCYLFNDNAAEWKPRREFRVASWKEEHDRKGPGALTRIWRGERLKDLREKALPVHPVACGRCTRHMAQNQFLSQLDDAVRNYVGKGGSSIRLEQILEGTDDPSDERWEPIWL